MTRESGGFTPEIAQRLVDYAMDDEINLDLLPVGFAADMIAASEVISSVARELRDWRSDVIPGTYPDVRIGRLLTMIGGEA